MGIQTINFILDTGTPLTVVDTAIADRLGYSARMGRGVVRLWGIEAPQERYRLEVSRLEIMGLDLGPIEVVCHDFLPQFGVEGLLGMDLLAGHILNLDFIAGSISLGP
jgi:predicted aspartyl protease